MENKKEERCFMCGEPLEKVNTLFNILRKTNKKANTR